LNPRRDFVPVLLAVLISLAPAIRGVWADENHDIEDAALSLGDRLAENGAFSQAITEYKRVLYFNQDEQIAGLVHARIAACYSAQRQWPEAIFHLRRSIQKASSLKEIEDREFDLVTALLASGRDSEAELHLLRLREFSVLDERRLSLYLVVTYTYSEQWQKAAEELSRAFPAEQNQDVQSREKIEQLELLFTEARETPRKSPQGALWLSTALPGAGQLYAGDPWDGLNALALNAGLVALIYAAVKREWYLEGVLLFIYPLRRYYLGNRNNARIAAERRNRIVDERYRKELLDGVLSLMETKD
jgi:tetratricopeptide (TPR) repeat protein